jgi:hypothetical protein
MHFFGRSAQVQYASQAAVSAQYSFIALYNDSTIGQILRVRSYNVATATAHNVLGFLSNAKIGSLVLAGASIFAGEQQAAGTLYSGSNTTAPTSGQFLGFTTTGQPWPSKLPLAYVRPGWSWVMQCDTVNIALVGSITWENLDPEQLQHYELA